MQMIEIHRHMCGPDFAAPANGAVRGAFAAIYVAVAVSANRGGQPAGQPSRSVFHVALDQGRGQEGGQPCHLGIRLIDNRVPWPSDDP